MDLSIAKRIENINKGIIPDGYKKTKVGIVPVEWEECKLSEFLNVNKDKNIDLKYNKEDVFSISGEYGVVNQMQFLGRSYAGESVAPYRIVYPFDIIYTKSPLKINPYGIIKSNQTNATGIVSTLYAVYHCKDNVLSKYIEYYFGLDSVLNNYLLPLVNIGSKHDMKISDENVLKGYVSFPPLPEQQKIAEILSTQDKLIELYERKIEHLKTLKKGYLQKMFPKKGCKYPELRFKGFTDDWEQRKLSSLCDKFTDGDWIEAKDQSNSGIRLIQTGNVGVAEYLDKPNNKKWISNDTFEALHCEEVFEGDILVSRLPEPAGRACIVPNLGTKMMTAVDCTIVRVSKKTSNEFLLQYLSSQRYFYEVNTCLAGGKRQRISRSNLANLDVSIPTQKNEQEAIGSFFTNLDNLITLHQHKLDKEKQKKKALMQLLLTGKVRVI